MTPSSSGIQPVRGLPTATYRLQLQPDFPFAAAAAAVPYLASLGVSHLHLSPVLEAVPGSTHGYDVVDHSRIRAELGGEDGLRALAGTARAHGLGLVADVVPNHMAVPAPERLNGPLWEVLRDGPESPYARWFDIDWTRHGGRVLLPVLGGRLGDELRHLRVRDGSLRYHDHAFPLRPGTEGLPPDRLLDAQHYRLGWWRLARTELNYRRFFTVSELIAVRVEDPEVFAATHGTLLRLVREGVLDGLRIDHPDGLADPAGYLRRLRKEAGADCWIVVEKILTDEERLPPRWPVDGTTGYDALHHVDGLFIDPEGAAELHRAYRAFTGLPGDRGGSWPATSRRAAHRVVTHELAAEVDRLVRTAGRICAADLRLRDHAPWALRQAVVETLVRLPVYRPYVVPGEDPAPFDERLLHAASVRARRTFADAGEADAVDVVRDAALGRICDPPGEDHRDFCVRFAQTAAALHAKAVEDTAFYRYAPLLSAAEVGGDPGAPAVAPDTFHTFCARIQRDWPGTATVLSTHDTKRSADVRARLAVLAEDPAAWADFVTRTDARAAELHGSPAPDPHVAWTAWQTAYGIGFPHPDAVLPAVLKAVREAGMRTGWTEPDTGYEEQVRAFTEAGPCGPSMYALAEFGNERRAAIEAVVLGAALLHLTMPGVPDLYQGTEREYLALVDPGNRSPVQFPDALSDRPPLNTSDRKLRLTATALRLRREHPGWFGPDGGYEALPADGPAAEHCVAFARAGSAVTVVTRLAAGLDRAGGWRDTALALPEGRWRCALSGRRADGRADLAELLAESPVALLVREPARNVPAT